MRRGKQLARFGRRPGTGIAGAILFALVIGLPGHLAAGEERPTVVATFSILGDFVARVAGDHAEVQVLAPVGAEVHEYELRPEDFIALERAEILFYNGYNLEQWMTQARATVRPGIPVVAVAEESGFETLSIVTGEFRGVPDPHLWMDPRAARAYLRVIAGRLAELMPEHADAFRENADRYKAELGALHEEVDEALAVLPEENRVLITSEAAFLYFAAAFGFHHDGIWGTNTETEGTSRQLMRIIDVIEERRPRAIFWESTITSRYVEGVAEDTGVSVAGPLYVDSLGDEESGAGTYPDMMRANTRILVDALTDD